MKIGRKHYKITEKDRVMDNSVCVQLLRAEKRQWDDTPVLSKSLFKKLLSQDVILFEEETDVYHDSHGTRRSLRYYKFDMDKVAKFELME